MAISAILGAGKAILGGIGQAQQIKAENRRRIREYERQLEMRKRNWFQQLSVYGAKVNKYNIDLNENDLAAQRGYAKAQSNLRALEGRVVAQNETKFRQLVSKKLGARRASGQTGRSVRRGETLDIAEYGRYTGRQAFGVSMAREKFKENAEVELYFDNQLKFETTAYGTNTFGTAETDTLIVTGVSTVASLIFSAGTNTNGVAYFDANGQVQSTVAPASGISTSNSILTTNASGVPIWTDTIDCGTF